MTESRKAPNAVTCPEARASEPSSRSQRPATMSSRLAERRWPAMKAPAANRLTTRPIIVRWLGRSRSRKRVRPTGSLQYRTVSR